MYSYAGLAEIIRDPSKLTRKYLDIWFTGSGAFGKGMRMLGWPIKESNKPLLVWSKRRGLSVDLSVEEEVLYSNTIFRYFPKKDDYELRIDFRKTLSIKCLLGSLRALWSQSRLLVNPQKTYDMVVGLVKEISLEIPSEKMDIEIGLAEMVWPRVVAIDYIGEFVFSAWSGGLSEKDRLARLDKIQKRNKGRDWYTNSLLAWAKYNDGAMSKQDFVEKYGYCSGDDYELTKPRYYEVLGVKRPKLSAVPFGRKTVKNLEDLAVEMQFLRSEVKRRSLVWIALLRESL